MNRPVRGIPTNSKESHYAGFDLSLTASGIVVLDSKGNVKERTVIKVKTRAEERLDDILREIRSIISTYHIKLVCIEGYATGAMGKTFHIGELGGVVRHFLYKMKIPYIDPKPTQVKKYATGKGGGEGGSKDQVTLHVFKNWNFEATDNNEADAYVLARIALGLTGHDKNLKKYQQEVIDQIHNPPEKKAKKRNETT